MLADPPKRAASDGPEVICEESQLLRESGASFPGACARLCFRLCVGGGCLYMPGGGAAGAPRERSENIHNQWQCNRCSCTWEGCLVAAGVWQLVDTQQRHGW